MALLSGSLSSAANGLPFTVATQPGANGIGTPTAFNVSVNTATGSFSGTYQIQRLIDQGVNWVGITSLGVPYNFTAGLSESFTETQGGVQYRITVIAYTSGTLAYQFGQ